MEADIKQASAQGLRQMPPLASMRQIGVAPLQVTGSVAEERATTSTAGALAANGTPRGQEKVNAATLEEAVRNLNDFVQNVQRNLQFDLDDESGRTVVRVLDAETDEVIRQMPSEEVLALAKHLRSMSDGQPGLFLQEKA